MCSLALCTFDYKNGKGHTSGFYFPVNSLLFDSFQTYFYLSLSPHVAIKMVCEQVKCEWSWWCDDMKWQRRDDTDKKRYCIEWKFIYRNLVCQNNKEMGL